MSSRGQTNSSRPRKPLEKINSRSRDHSSESIRSEAEATHSRSKARDDSRRRDNASRSRTSRSPRKGRDKDQTIHDKTSSSRNLSNRKDESKNRADNLSNEKGRESTKSPPNDRHALFHDGSRLSQLMRHITNTHDDNSRRVQAAKQFSEYLFDPAHLEPIKRNCSNIFTALEDVIKERGHNDLKDEVISCFGSIGQVLGIDCDKFFKWVFSKIPNAASDQLRALYLRTVLEAMKLGVGKQTFYDAMPRVMASLQDVLENADAPELLLIIMEIISIICTDYPEIFEEYFKDLVDILVGWHIDTTQSENLVQRTSECLVRFHHYWISNMNFSLTLLSQFLEDMEAHAVELKGIFTEDQKKEETASPYVALPKLNSLVQVYTTVIKGIGDFFVPGRGCPITASYVKETVERIIQCVDISPYSICYEKLFISANECLKVMIGYLGSHFASNCNPVAVFINAQLESVETLTFFHLRSLLSLLESMVIRVGVAIPLKVVQLLFDVKSPLFTLRHINDNEIYSLLLKTFQSLLGIKNIPLVETAYKFLVDDLVKSYSVLRKMASEEAEEAAEEEEITDAEEAMKRASEAADEVAEEEPKAKKTDDLYPVHEAYANVVFDLSVIAEIATYKSSVVGAWKVDPPTFLLLTETVSPVNWEVADHFPAVQFCVISTLYTHSQRCNHFLHVSNVKGSIVSPEFSRIIEIICQIVTYPTTCPDSRKLCLIWLTDIVSTIQGISSDVHRSIGTLSQVLDAQICSSYSDEKSVVEQSAVCLENLLQCVNLSTRILQRALLENITHLIDIRDDVKDFFLKIMLSFPTDVIAGLSGQLSQSSRLQPLGKCKRTEIVCRKDIWLAKKCHMNRPVTGTFRSHQFKIVMGHILQGLHSREGIGWIEQIYYSCQRLGKIATPVSGDVSSMQRFGLITASTLPKNAQCCEELLWFWATWESAQFCVLSKLKTPLGKPTETFQAIEGVLKELERRLRSGVSTNDKSYFHSKQSSEKDAKSGNFGKLQQSILLLQLLENLEKLMYNAFEGSAVSLPPPMRAVRNFFRTNRATCQEWLLRLRESASHLASMVGCPAAAVRHGFAWLQGLKESGNIQGADLERAVVVVVDALSKMNAWEAVTGVLEWAKKTVGRNLFWLSGAITKSKGSYEKASEQLRVGLDRYLSPDRQINEYVGDQKPKKIMTVLTKEPTIHADPTVTSYLTNQTLECYMKLGDWSAVQQWSQKIRETRQRLQKVDGLHAKVDMNYIKALVRFEDNDFPGVREQLELIPGATISNILQEQFPVLGTIKDDKDPKFSNSKDRDPGNMFTSADDSWKPSVLLTKSQIYLMQALTLYWTSGLNTLKGSRVGSLHSTSWQTVEDLLSRARESLLASLRGCLLGDGATSSTPYLMQLKSLTAIRETLLSIDTEQDQSTVNMSISGIKTYLDPIRTDIGVLNQALRASSYLQFHHSLHKKGWVAPTTLTDDKLPSIASLQVLSAKLARKQSNIKLAESLLAKQLVLSETKGSSDTKLINANLRLRQLSTSAHSGKVADPLSAVEILRESAKLKRVLGNLADGADTLCTSILLAERQHVAAQKTTNLSKLSEVSARSVLTLVQWMLAEPRLLSFTSNESDDGVMVGVKIKDILKVVVKSGGLSTKLLQNTSSSVLTMPECDRISGQLLHFSTHRCPNLSKTWYAYADWCYKWGRKAVEHTSVSGRIDLLEEEKENVIKVLPEGVKREEVEGVVSILSKAHCSKTISPEEDISTTELTENLSEDDEENTRRQLLVTCPSLLQDQTGRIDSLLSIWRGIVGRVFSHYKQASSAYFTFLKLGDGQVDDQGTSRSEYGNITATLRLLRLLVKYSGELKQELEPQLDRTPTRPWKGIIPQLFARLNHPEIYVQKSVANLLCRIAKEFPHLIVYPAVVGCSDVIPSQLSKTSAAGILRGYKLMDTTEYCDQPEDDAVESEVAANGTDSQEEQANEGFTDQVFQSSLHTILDSLSNDNPLLVSEVKMVVLELRRITLLWDELWIGSLMQLNHEAQRRIQQLEEEIKRVNANQTLSPVQKTALIKEKHTALMKPLVYSLERLDKITGQSPETVHEENFQKYFGATIQKAIERLKMPVDATNPQKNWEPLKQLHSSLHARTNRRSTSSLSMEEISPVLAKGKFSQLPMPGIDFTADQIVSLDSFANDVLILPTKTKPKKLVMIGSDGQRYTYLFKGLEDLHLDERITQFLEICNHMFAKEEKSNDMKYLARRYSVTPLGPRSGLIQWVDGATPIFSLYKRWQQREIAAQNLVKPDKTQTTPLAPMRPSEVFYNKITPLLKERGIQDLANTRKEWPLSILKKVFAELGSETPSDLLARELWCASTTASDWWEATQTYSRSVSVMSIIGYVIGLGDRHLDNILVDLSTGEVVHIDYNVCFEKGKALRVSERVPFRMTKNIETALGVTGVEGLYRISCEKVLQILRQGRETLLTLLEAFVYDPLVDWTTANDAAFAGAFYGGGAGGDDSNKFSKKEMERGITQTLLSTRVAEMKVSWTANRDELLSVLGKLDGCLELYCNALVQQQSVHREMLNLQHQHDLLKAALSRSDHPLHSLQARYDKQAKLFSELKIIKLQLREKMEECEKFSEQHTTGFNTVRGKKIAKVYTEVCKLAEIGTPSYGPAVNFLQSAGQGNVVSQCDQMESELAALLNQRRSSFRACLDTLFSYAAVTVQFPDEYANTSWCGKWIPWLERIVSDPSTETCNVVLQEHEASILTRAKETKESSEAVTTMEGNLHQYFTEQNTKLVKLIERRSQEPMETAALSGPVTETWNAVRKFIGDAGVAGATSLACVTITALFTLNTRYLVMENAAAVSGERLMHLTSRDGDWFLDELCTMCGNIAQLLSVLKNNPLRPKNAQKQDTLDQINNCMQVLFASVKVYSSFQELMTNFRTIIVPEALKGVQNQDESVLDIAKVLHEVIEECPMSLKKQVERLQSVLTEEGTTDADDVYTVIETLKSNLVKIVEPEEQAENDKDEDTSNVKMTPGQMLLAGFNGLFSKVELELNALYDACKRLQPFEGMEHVDLQQEQKNLNMSKKMNLLPFNHCVDLLFVRKLQVMDGFFTACIQQAAATKDLKVSNSSVCNGVNNQETEKFDDEKEEENKQAKKALCVFNEDLLSLPVKQFIAECVQQFVVGLPSRSLSQLILYFINLLHPALAKDIKENKKGNVMVEDLCKKAVEHNLKVVSFTHQHLSKASSLIHAHDVAWRKQDFARRLETAAVTQKNIVQRSQLQLARFQWLHEDIICPAGKKHGIPMANPSRASVMSEIKKRIGAIRQIEHSFPGLVDRYSQLQSSIEQRLKWAAGANPALNAVQHNFENAAEKRKQILQNESKMTAEVTGLANAILRLETCRNNNQDATAYDATVVSIVQKCKECCDALQATTGELGDVEQLMKNLQIQVPPKEPITIDWMKSRVESVDKQIKAMKLKERNFKSAIGNDKEALKLQVQSVKNLLTSHNSLVGEVKSLLKTLAKDDEAPECKTVRSFITTHNKFSEDASTALKGIIQLCSTSKTDKDEKDTPKLSSEDSNEMIDKIRELTKITNWLHDQLLAFGSSSLVDEKLPGETTTFASALRNLPGAKSGESTSPASSSQGGQQRKEDSTSPLFMTPSAVPKQPIPAPSPRRTAGLVRDPKTGKAMQEKNLYAVNVWRRVKAKLEGRDVDLNHRMTVAEQVDYVIKEAISMDNLCQLYEGWTPWV